MNNWRAPISEDFFDIKAFSRAFDDKLQKEIIIAYFRRLRMK